MVANFIILITLILLLYYAFSNENTQITATASAIRQIWSGTCRLSCQQSAHSGISGLSGLPQTTCQDGTSRDQCVCDSCPCTLIENFLRTCRPATQICGRITDTFSYYYSNLWKSISEACEYFARVLECDRTCRRQAQVSDNSENITGVGRDKEGKTKPIGDILDTNKPIVTKKKSSITFKEPLRINDSNEGTPSEGSIKSTKKMKSKVSEETLKPATSSESPGFCAKCVEKGEKCVSKCPRAKKKK